MPAVFHGGPLGIGREAHGMTSLAEAENKFGDVVRRAGGAIFGIEKSLSIGSRHDERLQIGTSDGFVKISVSLDQPDIDAVLRDRTTVLVKHAEELRKSSGLIRGSSSLPGEPVGRFRRPS
jgi:hypothetical protein